MKTAFVLWAGALGGTEALWVDLVERANESGHEAVLVIVTNAGPLQDRLLSRDLPFIELGFRTARAALRAPRNLGRTLSTCGGDGVVLATTGLLPALCRAGRFRGPLVAVEHGGLLNVGQAPAHVRLRKRLTRRFGRHMIDAEVGVSRHMLERLRNGDEAALTVCIPNGVDLRRFRPSHSNAPRDQTTVGWAGRMIPGKGLDVLIQALALTESSEIRLLLAGDGPQRTGLRELAHKLGVADRVQMLGPVQATELFWHQCDIGVAPSDGWEESFGIAPIEASASGLPVIASNHGALAEVVLDGVTGRLTVRGDAHDLASAMLEYHRDPSLRAAHGKAGLAHVRNRYSLDACLNAYLELLRSVSSPPQKVAQ